MLLKQDQKHWEKVGKGYSKFWQSKAKYELNKKELNFINKYLRKTNSKHLLDIGVGSGRIIDNYLIKPEVEGVNGVDWAKSMVSFCRNKFKKDKRVKSILVCDISKQRLPFKRKFDFISAIRVLKYNQNWQEIVERTTHSLKDRGIFVFTIPNKKAFLRFTTPETAIYRAAKKEVEQVVKEAGGEVLEITAFTKLPDIFYDLIDNRFYTKAILLFEELLKKTLGDSLLGREFFIAARKK